MATINRFARCHSVHVCRTAARCPWSVYLFNGRYALSCCVNHIAYGQTPHCAWDEDGSLDRCFKTCVQHRVQCADSAADGWQYRSGPPDLSMAGGLTLPFLNQRSRVDSHWGRYSFNHFACPLGTGWHDCRCPWICLCWGERESPRQTRLLGRTMSSGGKIGYSPQTSSRSNHVTLLRRRRIQG